MSAGRREEGERKREGGEERGERDKRKREGQSTGEEVKVEGALLLPWEMRGTSLSFCYFALGDSGMLSPVSLQEAEETGTRWICGAQAPTGQETCYVASRK